MKILRAPLMIVPALALAACSGSSTDRPSDQPIRDATEVRRTSLGTHYTLYEFEPATIPGTRCVFVSSNGSRPGGLACDFPPASATGAR